jgi:hypothetical protein
MTIPDKHSKSSYVKAFNYSNDSLAALPRTIPDARICTLLNPFALFADILHFPSHSSLSSLTQPGILKFLDNMSDIIVPEDR